MLTKHHLFRGSLFLSYPILVHLGIAQSNPQCTAIAIAALSIGIFYRPLFALKRLAWLGFGLWFTVLYLLASRDIHSYLVFIPPVILPLLVGGFFFSTLLPGQTPLVTDIGEQARGPLSEEMKRYTKKVTIAWGACLWVMALWGTILPIIGQLWLWSILTNIVNQLLVASLFLGEYAYRVWRFPQHDHPDLKGYFKIVFTTRPGAK